MRYLIDTKHAHVSLPLSLMTFEFVFCFVFFVFVFWGVCFVCFLLSHIAACQIQLFAYRVHLLQKLKEAERLHDQLVIENESHRATIAALERRLRELDGLQQRKLLLSEEVRNFIYFCVHAFVVCIFVYGAALERRRCHLHERK